MSGLSSVHDQTTTASSTSTSNDRDFVSKDAPRNIAQDNTDNITTIAPYDQSREEHLPSESQQPRGSLSLTPGPLQGPTTEDGGRKDTAISSSVGSQNAPGRAGSIGEATPGATGYGCPTVERPTEDQGLGKKIVNFLGV